MLRAPTSAARPESRTGLAGSAILSATLHAAVLLPLMLDVSIPFPEDVEPIEVELIVVEPEVERATSEEETPPQTLQQPEDLPEEESEPPAPTATSSPDKVQTARRPPRPGSSDLAERTPHPVETDSETADEKDSTEPPRSEAQSKELAELASLVDEERSSLQDSLPLAEVPGCSAAGRAAPTRGYIDQLAKSAQTGRSYAQAAVSAQMGGDYQKAIDLYDAAILAGDLSRNNLAKVYNNRGAAYRNMGFSGLPSMTTMRRCD
jgi:outer membrane biosynthesis protein TonB